MHVVEKPLGIYESGAPTTFLWSLRFTLATLWVCLWWMRINIKEFHAPQASLVIFKNKNSSNKMKQNTPQVVTTEEWFFEQGPEMTPPQIAVPSVFQPPLAVVAVPPSSGMHGNWTYHTHPFTKRLEESYLPSTFSFALRCSVVWPLPCCSHPHLVLVLWLQVRSLGFAWPAAASLWLLHCGIFLFYWGRTGVSGDVCTHKVIAVIKSSHHTSPYNWSPFIYFAHSVSPPLW